MSNILDTTSVFTDGLGTETHVSLDKFKGLGGEQLLRFRDVDMIANYPRQLRIHALLGRAISRAKVGALIQCQADTQEALQIQGEDKAYFSF